MAWQKCARTKQVSLLPLNRQKRRADLGVLITEAGFKDTLRGYEITAARQNNQSARVWVVSDKQELVSQEVRLDSSPPSWEMFWTPDI